MLAAFSSEASLLDTSERYCYIGDGTGVDADHAYLENFGDPIATRHISGVEISADSTYISVVGELYNLRLGVEWKDSSDRAKGFLMR